MLQLGNLDTCLINILNIQFTSRARARLSGILDEELFCPLQTVVCIESRSQEKIDKAPTALSSDTESKKALAVK